MFESDFREMATSEKKKNLLILLYLSVSPMILQHYRGLKAIKTMDAIAGYRFCRLEWSAIRCYGLE